jgi:hypothetical protein
MQVRFRVGPRVKFGQAFVVARPFFTIPSVQSISTMALLGAYALKAASVKG